MVVLLIAAPRRDGVALPDGLGSAPERGGGPVLFGAYVILYSTDAEADKAFLRDVLGFPSVDAGRGWLIFKLPPAEAAVHPAAASAHELYFMCDNHLSELDSLRAIGVACFAVEASRWGRSPSSRSRAGARSGSTSRATRRRWSSRSERVKSRTGTSRGPRGPTARIPSSTPRSPERRSSCPSGRTLRGSTSRWGSPCRRGRWRHCGRPSTSPRGRRPTPAGPWRSCDEYGKPVVQRARWRHPRVDQGWPAVPRGGGPPRSSTTGSQYSTGARWCRRRACSRSSATNRALRAT
jgi:hypothetical protein